jgi:glutaredoxin-dependent peroxiredoxin
MTLSVGTGAPLFTLKQKTEKGLQDISLADTLGKKNILLLFFPFAFTGVCTEELCSVTQGLDGYESLDATVYAISVDSPFAQEAWAKQNNIKVPLLSDFNKKVCSAYYAMYEDFLGFQGVAKRAAFVINKEGNISYAWAAEDPKQVPDFQAIQSHLEELIA